MLMYSLDLQLLRSKDLLKDLLDSWSIHSSQVSCQEAVHRQSHWFSRMRQAGGHNLSKISVGEALSLEKPALDLASAFGPGVPWSLGC